MTFSSIFRNQGAILITALVLALSACSTSGFKADVSRFHALAPATGQTFQVIPDPKFEDSIEFKSYLGFLSSHLSNVGYLPALSEDPDFDIFLDYGSRPDPNYRPSSGPLISIGVGGFGSNVGGGVGTTFDTSDPNAIYFLHSVNMVINDAKTGQRLYEGTASGHGKGPGINTVMPLLLEALFQDFPGASGTTNTIKLATQ